jgi:hypothetical protein
MESSFLSLIFNFVAMFIFSGGYISALLDVRSGMFDAPQLMWSFNTSGRVHSTPVASAKSALVIVGCDDFNLYALNSTTGELIWVFNTGFSIGKSSPSLGFGRVYIGSNNFLFAISVDTGSLIWSVAVSGRLSNSAPVIAGDGSVYVGTDTIPYSSGSLVSVDMNGNIIFSVQASSGNVSSPAIGADGSIFVFSSDGTLAAIGMDNACPSGKAIPLDFMSTDETYSCAMCPPRYTPTGASCTFCGPACPLQPFKEPQYIDPSQLLPIRPRLVLSPGSSIELLSDLNISDFDVTLRETASLILKGSVRIDKDSVLTIDPGSQILIILLPK